MGFPGGSGVKSLPANAGDRGLIPASGRFPGRGNGNALRHSCLGRPMDKGAWWATGHGTAKGQAGLSTHNHHSRIIFMLQSIGASGSFFPNA